jgi:hypothetical protein
MGSVIKAASEDYWWLAGGIDSANCIAAYQPIGAASYAVSLTDLSGSGNDVIEITAPDWTTTNGWSFDGSTALKQPDFAFDTETFAVVMRFSDYVSGYSWGPTPAAMSNTYIREDTLAFVGQNTGVNGFDGSAQDGVVIMTGVSPNQVKYYINNSLIDTHTVTHITGTATQTGIGCIRTGNPIRGVIKIQALSVYSIGLSTDIVSALTTAMNAL